MNTLPRLARYATAFCATFALPLSAHAVSTWNGASPTTSNWSDGANWGGTAPVSASSTDIVFGGNTRLTSRVDSPFTLKTLIFNSTAGSYTLSGSQITVAGVNNSTIAINNQSASAQTISNSILLSGAALFRAQAGNLTFGAIDLNAVGLVLQADVGKTIYLNGVISDSKSSTTPLLEFYGAGTFVVSGSNTYTERTRIRSGTVLVKSNGAFGTGSSLILGGGGPTNSPVALLTDGAVTVNRVVNIAYAAGNTYTVGGTSAYVSSYSQTVRLANDANDIALNLTAAAGGRVNFASELYDGVAGGRGSVKKIGQGIVDLSGSLNSYLGETEVSAGTLLINGTLLTSVGQNNVTVKSGATLGGRGTINRLVVVEGGGILSAGDINALGNSEGGLLTLGAGLTLSDGAKLFFDLGLAGDSTNDRIAITGNFTLDGLIQINPKSGFNAGTYTLFTYSGGSFTNNGLELGDAPTGFDYQIQVGIPGQVNLIVTAVPEPATVSLLVGAGLLFVANLRFRRG